MDELADLVGSELGVSDWQVVTHVDPERARSGPFGQTIAHGFLTLALLPALLHDLALVDGYRLAVNYGLNRVRFPAPVPVGARIRARAILKAAEAVAGGTQVVLESTVEVEGQDKPGCVAETVTRYYV
jgi:acyl dehydratase